MSEQQSFGREREAVSKAGFMTQNLAWKHESNKTDWNIYYRKGV